MKIIKGIALMLIGAIGVILGVILVAGVATFMIGAVIDTFKTIDGNFLRWLLISLLFAGVVFGLIHFISSSPDMFKNGWYITKEWFKNGKESR